MAQSSLHDEMISIDVRSPPQPCIPPLVITESSLVERGEMDLFELTGFIILYNTGKCVCA